MRWPAQASVWHSRLCRAATALTSMGLTAVTCTTAHRQKGLPNDHRTHDRAYP